MESRVLGKHLTGPAANEIDQSVAGRASEQLKQRALGPAASDFGQEVRPLGKEAGELTVRAVRVGLRGVAGLVWGF